MEDNQTYFRYTGQERINRHDLQSMGIDPTGIDYCRVEDIIANRASQLKLPHRHEYYEIIWFTECSGTHMVEFAHYELQPNMLFFFPRNQIHAFITTEGLKGHMLRFDESFIKSIPESDVSLIERTLFKIHASPVRYLPPENHQVFDNLISLIITELAKKDEVHHLEMLRTLLNALLIESERILPALDNQIGIDKRALKRFYQFTALLEDNFHLHYTVQQYAELMNMAPKTLRNTCKQVSGLSVKTIIQNRIILEAKLYLQNTNLNVQEISDRLGFEDPAYFSRFFRKATQVSPSMARSQAESGND